MLQNPTGRLLLTVITSSIAGAQGAPAVVEKIIKEGQQNSHVWETLIYLSEEIGTRLTGSSGLEEAGLWTQAEFERLGLKNSHLAKWGEIGVRFDRGPSRASMVAPVEREFEFTTQSWGAGTQGPVRGPVFLMPTTQEELDLISERLDGAWILSKSSRRRRSRDTDSDEKKAAAALADEIEEVIAGAPLAGRIRSSRNDLVITGGVRGWRDLTMDTLPQEVEILIRRSDYTAMEDLLKAGESVVVEADLQHHFSEGPIPIYNTVAEIPGSEWPEQIVILSAHLDSWDGPGSMGTQDNGTGSSVMLEAARILMAAGVQPRRTIRFCLWTGEEQGLLGSRAYVDSLGEDELANISAAFVDDGGTNYQGGLVCIESMLPMLEEAVGPAARAFPDYDVLHVVNDAMPKGGSSDHASFNRKGVPGFFWIEKGKGGREEKNYGFIHHTQHDTPRYAVEEYLVQSATTSAVTAYNLAMADSLLPRELPKAEGEGQATQDGPAIVEGPLSGFWETTIHSAAQDAPRQGSATIQHLKGGGFQGETFPGDGKFIKGEFDEKTGKGTFVHQSDEGRVEGTLELKDGVFTCVLKMAGETVATVTAKRPALMDCKLNGVWEGEFAEMDATFTLTFSVYPDSTVRGRYKSSQSDSPLSNGKWNGKTNTVTFEYNYPHAGLLPVTAQLKDGKLSGTINESMGFTATLKK